MGGDVYNWHWASDFGGYWGLSILVSLGLVSRKPSMSWIKKILSINLLKEAMPSTLTWQNAVF